MAALRKPIVLLVESTVREPDPTQWARIQERFRLLRYDCRDEEEFCKRLQPGGPYAGIDAILRVGWLKAGSYAGHQLFRGRPVTCYPPSLKLICCTGHGYDAADVPALTARGILYANSPDTCTEAVANTALYLILGSYRYFSKAEEALRTDRWAESRQLGPVAVDPVGQVLGIVGLGAIGGAIARKAALGLGMQIHYHNRRPCPPATISRLLGTTAIDPASLTYHDSLASLLRVADCVCLACPLTAETQQLMGAAQFALARQHRPQGIRLVNIARGGLVDEDALLAAIEAKTVVGVGLDVHAREPDGVRPELRDNRWTTLLPHIGVCSRTSWRNFDTVTLNNLESYFYGDRAQVTAVNAKVLEAENRKTTP